VSRISPLSPPSLPAPGQTSHWTRLAGSSRALALSALAGSTGRPILVLTPDSRAAQGLVE